MRGGFRGGLRAPCLADLQLSAIITVVLFGDCNAKTSITSALLRRLTRGYEKLPPSSDGPVIVELGVYINYFYDISDITMDYTLSMYLRQQWYDKNLSFSASDNLNNSRLKVENISQIWVPDTIFGNEKSASLHEVTVSNSLLYIHTDGKLWYVSKVSALLSCPMKLHRFPLDVQTCPLLLRSCSPKGCTHTLYKMHNYVSVDGYSANEVLLKWLNTSAVQFDPTSKFLPQFTVQDFTLSDCSFNDSTANPPGLYSCLEASFIIHRGLVYYLIQYYIPSVLLVTLSWLSFWISIDAVVARVSIGLLTVLSLSLQSTNSQFQLPRVSYVKAIDVWMSACLIFAFASLIEFAVVNVWSRKEEAGVLGPRGGEKRRAGVLDGKRGEVKGGASLLEDLKEEETEQDGSGQLGKESWHIQASGQTGKGEEHIGNESENRQNSGHREPELGHRDELSEESGQIDESGQDEESGHRKKRSGHREDNRRNNGKILRWGGVTTDEEGDDLTEVPSHSTISEGRSEREVHWSLHPPLPHPSHSHLPYSSHLHENEALLNNIHQHTNCQSLMWVESRESSCTEEEGSHKNLSVSQTLHPTSQSDEESYRNKYQGRANRRQSTWREGLTRRQSAWKEGLVRRQSMWKEGLVRRQSMWREGLDRRSSAMIRRMSMVAESLKVSRRVRQARAIDDLARKLFPTTFLIFNIIYWLSYSL